MPAKNLLRVNEERTCSHIYNKGIESRTIFNDQEDYEVFLGYLKDYLTPPGDPESTKKDFTINGRSFRGTPHQPKNYRGKADLIAYNLMPDHFHLLLEQKTRGALASFIRSLCTRYSMYFNKKYDRSGTLFAGPYKSAQVKNEKQLLFLTRYFHNHSGGISSYPEYLGQKETSWVNTKVILSSKDLIGGYKNFVEKHELSPEEKNLLEGITLESGEVAAESQALEGSLPAGKAIRVPEYAAIFAIFVLLTGLGLYNINTTSAKNLASNPAPAVLSSSIQATASPKPAASPAPKNMVVVKITDGAETVNIRRNPTVNSEKIGEAKDGETFEFVSINSGWYEIKLSNGSTGFILSAYAYLGGNN